MPSNEGFSLVGAIPAASCLKHVKRENNKGPQSDVRGTPSAASHLFKLKTRQKSDMACQKGGMANTVGD
jgi:hypothetical protein